MDSFEFKLNKNEIIKQPSICFACICKNDEQCILTALESVCRFIDYWVICDTGSTDTTCELITTFFKGKGIPGELFHDTWENVGHNKTLLFDKCYKKADYILHFDADNYFVGELRFKEISFKTQFYVNVVKLDTVYPCLLLFDANFKWKFCGVAHITIKCLDCTKVTTGYLTDKEFYVYSNNNNNDPEKFVKESQQLTQQFFDTLLTDPDNLNTRSIFYTAQSYRDSKNFEEAAKWYKLYTLYKDTWNEELYYSYLQLGIIYTVLKFSFEKIESCYKSAINVIKDRAEAYLQLGMFYNQNQKYNLSYDLLKYAKGIRFEDVKKQYILFLNKCSYGKYINDELSVACYWLGKYQEGLTLLNEILDDPDFEYCKPRLLDNENHFKRNLK